MNKEKIDNIKKTLLEKFNFYNNNFNSYLSSKWLLEHKELFLLNLRDSLVLIVLLIISIVTIFKWYFIFDEFLETYKNTRKTYFVTKQQQKELETKIQFNLWYKWFSDILQYWTKIKYASWEEFSVPEKWYLKELDSIFPKQEDLNFWTFIEWWLSDFEEYKWKIIRKDNNIIKSFSVAWEMDVNENFKKVIYNLELEWNRNKINSFVNVLTSWKIQSWIESYDEKKTQQWVNLIDYWVFEWSNNVLNKDDNINVIINIAYLLKK